MHYSDSMAKLSIFAVLFSSSRSCGGSASTKCSSCTVSMRDQTGHQQKPKHTIIKKIIKNKGTFTVVQSKLASNVMKKLNWENLHMYGSIIATKSQQHKTDAGDGLEPSKIIQHVPVLVSNSNASNNSAYDEAIESEDVKLSVLNFPLINNLSSPESKNVVAEVNLLRKHLTDIHGNKSFPSVTSILDKTMPPERVFILERWKEKMIKQLGEEGFQKYKQDLFSNGSSLHSSVNSLLSGAPETEVQVVPANVGHWKSLKHVFPGISHVKLLEEHITHPFLLYKGVVDCFAMFRDHLVVIDWKTSQKQKLTLDSTYDNPLQIAAYVGALNFDPKFQYMVGKGLIVVAYENGAPANVHLLNEPTLLKYWKQWLKRLKLYWETIEPSKNN